ncbi:MAG: alpha-hydroxy-acid oxidizing protein [Acetobacteraceae bacterium]
MAGFIARHRLNRVYCLEDFEKLSKSCLPRAVYEYVRNGAGAEISLHYNEAAFHALLWQPFRLRQIDKVETGVTIFGETYKVPFDLAPTGGAAMVHYDADRLEGRVAHRHDTPCCSPITARDRSIQQSAPWRL